MIIIALVVALIAVAVVAVVGYVTCAALVKASAVLRGGSDRDTS
jgi:hypothetical protein